MAAFQKQDRIAVVNALDGNIKVENWNKLMELEPYEQITMAAAVCFFVETGPNHADELIEYMMQRAERAGRGVPKSLTNELAEAGQEPCLKVMTLFLGFDALRAPFLSEAIRRVPTFMPSMKDHMHFMPSVILSPNKTATEEIVQAEGIAGFAQSRPDIRTPADWMLYVHTNQTFMTETATVLVLINLPPHDGKLNNNTLTSEEPFKTAVDFGRCIEEMKMKLGVHNVYTMAFAQRDREDAATDTLIRTFGPLTKVPETDTVEALGNVPDVFATTEFNWVKVLATNDGAATTSDGEAGAKAMKSEYRDDNHSYKITKNFAKRVQATDPLTMAEHQTIVDFEGRDKETGGAALPTREWWCTQFGLHGRHSLQIFEKSNPCHPEIFPSTGTLATQKASKRIKCGSSRYCVNCQSAIQRLHMSYHANIVINGVCNVLVKLLRTRQALKTVGAVNS